MFRQLAGAVLVLSAVGALAQSPAPALAQSARPKFDAFEVATIKPVEHDAKSGRSIVMQGTNRFVE